MNQKTLHSSIRNKKICQLKKAQHIEKVQWKAYWGNGSRSF